MKAQHSTHPRVVREIKHRHARLERAQRQEERRMAKKAPPPALTAAQAERIALLEEFVTAFDGWVMAGVEQNLPAIRFLSDEQRDLLRARTLTAKAYVEHVRRALGNVPKRPEQPRPVILVQ